MKLIIIIAILSLSSCGYNKICIEGHTYFQKGVFLYETTAIKLDDIGHPVKCKDGDYNK